MRPVVLLATLILTLPALAQMPADSAAIGEPATDPATFRVYTGEGTAADLGALVAALAEADVVFLGEQHNDPVAHALQLDLLRAATEGERPVALSLEMFEQDVQLVLDEYLAGLIRERDFLAAARPWSNYGTDYRPLVEHAKTHGQAVLASNAPARYVRLVSQQDVEALALLPDEARAFLPLPVAPPSEALAGKFMALMSGMMGHGGSALEVEAEGDDTVGDEAAEDETAEDSTSADGTPKDSTSVDGASEEAASDAAEAKPHAAPGMTMPSLDGMLAAQNLRDVAMADAIAQHLAPEYLAAQPETAEPGVLVLHVNGAFHSESGLGVPEHLARLRPDARLLVVTMRPADDLEAFDTVEHASLGDFVVLTDARLPRTYEAGF